MPAPTRALATVRGRSPELVPIVVTATIIGSPVALSSTIARRSAAEAPGGAVNRPDRPRTSRNRTAKPASRRSAVGLPVSAARSNRSAVPMPVATASASTHPSIDRGEEGDGGARRHPAENGRPEHETEDDLEDDQGDRHPPSEPVGQERRHRRDDEHQQERHDRRAHAAVVVARHDGEQGRVRPGATV
jgi:hypothetical protein